MDMSDRTSWKYCRSRTLLISPDVLPLCGIFFYYIISHRQPRHSGLVIIVDIDYSYRGFERGCRSETILIINIMVTFELHNHRRCKYWFANIIMSVDYDLY